MRGYSPVRVNLNIFENFWYKLCTQAAGRIFETIKIKIVEIDRAGKNHG